MNNNATLEKMKKMRLNGMHRAFETTFSAGNLEHYTADQLITYLVESEWDERQNSRTQRLIKNARFRYQAAMEEIDFNPQRMLDKDLLLRLADCSFIDKGENAIITGSTGVGKSYIATALGYQACIKGYKVMYINTGKLFTRLSISKADETYLKELSRIEKQDLLILDDFGLQPIDQQKQLMLLDIMEDRQLGKSTVISTQIPVKVWYELFEEKTIADAILDRIVHQAHRIEIKGESMRRRKSKQ